MKKLMKIVISILMVSYATSAFSQEAYNFQLMWGSLGTGDGQFNVPVGVVVDSSGNVYVADSHNNRIQKFDSNGNIMTQWGSPFFIHDYPRSVAVDLSGNVYALGDDNTLQKFDSGGNLITSSVLSIPLNLLCPGQIAVDSPGNIYATAYYCCNVGCCFLSACPLPLPDRFGILKFDLNGNLIAKWGDWGTGDGQFNGPQGIVVDSSGHLYVADQGNNHIQKFDSNGNFVSKWGTEGTEDSEFSGPYGVAVDSAGNVYVSDAGNNRVQKFDSSGNFITKWGYWGKAEGQFDDPGGIAVGPSADVYVADVGNQRIQEFSRSAESVSLPDLTGQWNSLTKRCRSNRNGPKCAISGRLNIQNIGDQNAPSSFVRFYLSNDPLIDGGDIFLKQLATGSIRIGRSNVKMLSYSFPLGETVSGKYIIAVVDADNAITESDKSNNVAVFGPIQ